MQANERIRVQPMTTRGGPFVDDDDLDGICLGHERVRERQPARSRSHDQIVGVLQHFASPDGLRA